MIQFFRGFQTVSSLVRFDFSPGGNWGSKLILGLDGAVDCLEILDVDFSHV